MVLEKGHMEARGKLRGEAEFVLNHLWTRPQLRGHRISSPKVISRTELVLARH